jgi:O-antigen ligase/tetratricopeptide (TPR) repeat protein
MAACAGLTLIVGFYPFYSLQSVNERDAIVRRLAMTVLVAGFMVATIALVERATWNGKILWSVVPYDWVSARPLAVRARGPFVNPDHLADYLDMILPLSVCGLLFPETLVSRRRKPAAQACLAVATVIIVSAIFLSGSRGGWIAALFGVAIFGLLCGASGVSGRQRRMMSRRTRAAGFAVLLIATIFVCGAQGIRQADQRLGSALDPGGSASFRLGVWSQTAAIVQQFPLFGVGLGTYQDILPHFEKPPWTPAEVRAAHNDYLQFGAEAGLLGAALAAWLCAAACLTFIKSLRVAGGTIFPPLAALLCGLASLAVHEICEFSLHTVANAIMAAVIAGLAIRIGCSSLAASGEKRSRRGIVSMAPSVAILAILAIAAVRQDLVPYPYNEKTPLSLKEAAAWRLSHPARAEPHFALASLDTNPSADAAIGQLRAAVWLAPVNPYIRDSLAYALIRSGRASAAMRQISLSVALAPDSEWHAYLSWRLIPWLSVKERAAIEAGFLTAVARGYAGAVENLGAFYEASGRATAEARLYESAARTAASPKQRERYLVGAGDAYARLREYSEAENDYSEARDIYPLSESPYEKLIEKVYVPEGRFDAADKLITTASRSGLEPYPLFVALGGSAAAAGANGRAERAFAKAVGRRPYSLDAIAGLGHAYAAQGRYAEGAYWLRRAAEIRPESCQLRYELAEAEEESYDYEAARGDYEKAVRASNGDRIMTARYESFKLKLRNALRNSN